MNVFHLRFYLVASVMASWESLMQTCWWPLSDHWSGQLTSPHLAGFEFYGGLESLMELSALWVGILRALRFNCIWNAPLIWVWSLISASDCYSYRWNTCHRILRSYVSKWTVQVAPPPPIYIYIYIYIRNPNFVITVFADVLLPNGARPSVDKVINSYTCFLGDLQNYVE